MFNIKSTLFGLYCVMAVSAAHAASDANVLTVQASGFTSSAGQAVAKLFRPGEKVTGPSQTQLMSTIEGGRAVFTFTDLAPGKYAVVVFHDQNKNGEIDHNAIGLPGEPLGFSNGFSLGLTSGMPTFDKLSFSYTGGPLSIELLVK